MSPLTQGLNYRSACDRVEKPELLLDVDVNGSRKIGILCLRYIVRPLTRVGDKSITSDDIDE